MTLVHFNTTIKILHKFNRIFKENSKRILSAFIGLKAYPSLSCVHLYPNNDKILHYMVYFIEFSLMIILLNI